MTQQKTISYDSFLDDYLPIKNHLKEEAAFDGFLFETYGEELEFIRNQPKTNIWTLVEDDELTVISGFHQVNRLGYFITKIPVAEGHRIEAPL